MRRVLLLVTVLVFVDTMLYAALTPLLPHFAHEFGLSKSGAGGLVAAYAAGALLGGMPGGIAATRIGPPRAVLGGLALVATASVGFAFADSTTTLFVARFVQGIGSAFTWAGAFSWLLCVAPRERRGELIGTAMGAAVVGALFGPVVGAVAAAVGRAAVFTALAALAAALAVWTVRLPAPSPEERSSTGVVRALSNGTFAGGAALLAAASLFEGLLSVLGPLHLSAAGFGASAIGAIWLVSAALEAAAAPLVGRASDRSGTLGPVRAGLFVGVFVSVLLALGGGAGFYAVVLVTASVAYGTLFTPAFALIADGADRVGLAQGVAFGLMNAAWAVGAVVGPAAGGALAGAGGDWLPFTLAAVLCALGLTATGAGTRRRVAAG